MLKLNRQQLAFTILELLIVIALIGILAGLVLNNFAGSQNKAKIATAESTVSDIKKAILAMQIDTGKWPLGCDPATISNPESILADTNSGLTTAPTPQVNDTCEWTAGDIALWDGPYYVNDEVKDPWGGDYWVDPDYYPYQSCSSQPNGSTTVAVVTRGPDNQWYTCDDVFAEMPS